MAVRPPRHIPRDSSRRRLWVYIAVAAFILVDILLIAWALSSTRAGLKADAPRAIPTFAAVSSPTPPAVTPEPTIAALEATPVVAVPPTRILAALDATTAWRALTGECPATPASPELTTDSGATWKATDATGPTGVTALQRIGISSTRVASMVGLARADCSPQFVKTYVAGDNYASYPEELASAWYVNPANRATVHSPAGDLAAPCAAVIALAPRDADAAAVLCADQTVFTTADAAATWSLSTSVPGAVNLAVSEAGYLAAAVGRVECPGVQILAVTAALEASESGCYPMDVPPSSLPGSVALSDADGTVWLWAGDALIRSSNSGATWQ